MVKKKVATTLSIDTADNITIEWRVGQLHTLKKMQKTAPSRK